MIEKAFPPLVAQGAAASRTPFFKAHSPAAMDYLREVLGTDLPAPDYEDIGLTKPNSGAERPAASPVDVGSAIRRSLAREHLRFTDWQIASVFTALQTKGFVILSGISGTGKTKLAQHIASLFPQPQEAISLPDDRFILTVRPYMLDYHRLVVPSKLIEYFNLQVTSDTTIDVRFGDQSQRCRLSGHVRTHYAVVQLLFRGKFRDWFGKRFKEGDRLALEPILGDEQELIGLRVVPEDEWQQPVEGDGTTVPNLLFLSVRPDWRDSKSLLGYFNPLTESYEWTPFLRFLLLAMRSYQRGDGLVWFVILDEMNLAHVEYYLADLLSVLESGRDADGWTREKLRFVFPEDAVGEFPPRELALPPNLYLIGTVNFDETTYAFSPKVLDRAFAIELVDVDFRDYPPASEIDMISTVSEDDEALLSIFNRDGAFATIDKDVVVRYLATRPEVRTKLQRLNEMLAQYQGNRILGVEDFEQVGLIPARLVAFDLNADLGGGLLLQELQR